MIFRYCLEPVLIDRILNGFEAKLEIMFLWYLLLRVPLNIWSSFAEYFNLFTFFRVCYSAHSSLTELRDFVMYFSPKVNVIVFYCIILVNFLRLLKWKLKDLLAPRGRRHGLTNCYLYYVFFSVWLRNGSNPPFNYRFLSHIEKFILFILNFYQTRMTISMKVKRTKIVIHWFLSIYGKTRFSTSWYLKLFKFWCLKGLKSDDFRQCKIILFWHLENRTMCNTTKF